LLPTPRLTDCVDLHNHQENINTHPNSQHWQDPSTAKQHQKSVNLTLKKQLKALFKPGMQEAFGAKISTKSCT